MTRTDHIRLMANYNIWMNGKLLAAAESLPADALCADRQAFFGSILGTLNHLAVADTIWLKRFATHPAGYAALEVLRDVPLPAALNQPLFSDLQAFAEYRKFIDKLIMDWTAAITEADLDYPLVYTNTRGVTACKVFFSLLMHFFNHQTHHRGQATTLFSQFGVDVGVTDLLALIADEPGL